MTSSEKLKKSHCALILPGAVSKGAYEAGAIGVLAQNDARIDRIVATSSGALNGVAYAAGIRAGHEREMAEKLTQAWIELGGWKDAFHFNPLSMVTGRGLSNRSGLLKMLHEVVKPCTHSKKRDVELRIIVSPLNGIHGKIGEKPATTYEKVFHFSGIDFDTPEGLERIFDVTTAASAFPGLFAPVDLSGIGLCLDGGTVNNAPIAYALDEGDIDHVIVPIPFPELLPPAEADRGLGLLNHLVGILINERLYRDLKDAEMVNDQVGGLDHLVKNTFMKAEKPRLGLFLNFRKFLKLRMGADTLQWKLPRRVLERRKPLRIKKIFEVARTRYCRFKFHSGRCAFCDVKSCE
jgi:predicted acylesterase/phospholipase RssA